MTETSGGLRKISIQFTAAQMAWIETQAVGKGQASIASVLRGLVDEAMLCAPLKRRAS